MNRIVQVEYRKYTLALLVWLLMPFFSAGQSRSWEIAVAGGAVHNFKTPLRIQQHDFESIRLNARYRTEPFNPPLYYDIRISTRKEASGWELKFTHHKLILRNNPPEVQRFSITDGFNLLTLNRMWLYKGLTLSAGGGIVITHPESTIRNRPFPENKGILNKGYYVSGPTLEAAVAKRYFFADKWFLLGEGRMTASYVEVPVADGTARLANVALHGLLGVGFSLK
jgi:hypothetical protein